MRTLAEVLADMAAVERKLTRVQQKADHYNAEVRAMEEARRRYSSEYRTLRMLVEV